MAQLATQRTEVALPEPGTWTIDAAHSAVTFTARHLMIAKVRGRFTDVSGTVVVDRIPERSTVGVTIQAASIDTSEPKRDEHLRSPDFFDVENHPSLMFQSTSFRRTGEVTFELEGDLTIRGVTKPVVLRGEYDGLAGDPWGNQRAAFTASTEIDREAWGLTWNQALETGGVLVGRKVKIDIEVSLVRD